MRIIDITHPPKDLWIGRESENKFRPIAFECANWFETYPNATIVAYYQPYATNDPYPLVLSVDGTKRIWHPIATELVKGNGELQIVLMLGDVVGTSAIIPTKVDRSLISSADHPASEAPSWAVEVVLDVNEAASHYPQIVNGYWWVWDVGSGEWINTDVKASGGDIDPSDIADAVEDYMDEHPFVETDPTVPNWAKQPTKPTYTAQEVGALPDSTVIPTVPQMAVDAVLDGMDDWTSGKTVDAATLKNAMNLIAQGINTKADVSDIPTAVSDLTNDSGYQTATDVQTAISPLQTKSITDTGGYYTTDTVEGALQEIGAELAGVNTLIGSGVIT